ncbi:MAG: glycosyltransferase family 2 protein [Paracoccaceae bacterium]
MTRISAIVTCYNVEEYVATAMQSVIDAEFEDLELIVVDDGSSDATRQIADLVGGMAPNDRVRHVPIYFAQNTIGGVACAANAGLDHATGEVVIFVDGDDWVLPHPLRAAVDRLLESDADLVVCGCEEYWNNSGRYTSYPEMQVWSQLPQLASLEERRDAVLRMAPFPWRKIYRREFLERHNIRFPVGDYFFEDNPFHWSTSTLAEAFDFYEPVTHVHRMAREGQTVTDMGTKPLQIFEHASTIRTQLERTGSMERLRPRYFQWLADHVLWCARHVPVHVLSLLYDKSIEAFSIFEDDEIWAYLPQKERKIVEIRRLSAILLQDRLGFLREFPPA